MDPKLAVIQFPGSNCEYETERVAKAQGFDAHIVRWNDDADKVSQFDAYVLPGGFSFQDRVRAGVIATKLPVLTVLERAVDEGKPVLGICNGCQILAEAGLIPDVDGDKAVEVALAPNQRDHKPHGFVCDWTFVKVSNPSESLFTQAFEQGEILPIPINHGEGRFVLADGVWDQLTHYTQLRYCTHDGEELDHYPINPNGTSHNLAGITNKLGNVMGMMPHPERASFIKQIPFWIGNEWAQKKRDDFRSQTQSDGPWGKLFQGIRQHVVS